MNKHKFASFARRTNPLPLAPKSQKPAQPRILLPNGFCVGDRVYYNSVNNRRVYGTVVSNKTISEFMTATNCVWCRWDNSPDEILYMPTKAVHLDDSDCQ